MSRDNDIPEVVPVTVADERQAREAAQLLEQASKAGLNQPETHYLLALCYKRLGKLGDARGALRKIAAPDANVLLQLGLLSFREKQYAQAEEDFARSFELDKQSYAACYNLFLARLCLGHFDRCATLLPQLIPLAPAPDDRRLLQQLSALLGAARTYQKKHDGPLIISKDYDPSVLARMSASDEERLQRIVLGIGSFDAIFPMLQALALERPHSPAVQATYLEVVLVQAKRYLDRCDWKAANKLLQSIRGDVNGISAEQGRPLRLVYHNLAGCSACLLQDFDRAVEQFQAALKLANDPWLHQNLALALEWAGQLDRADTHWNRYYDLLDGRVPQPPLPGYLETLTLEGLYRLSDLYSRKERWNSALAYVQRAQRLRPDDLDTLEKLFHLYIQAKRPDEARRILRKMRELKPNDPQLELYELDLRDIRSLDDIDRILGDIKKIMGRFPGDVRVEERALSMVSSFVPAIGQSCDRLSERLAGILGQVRRLPNYQINWPVVHDEMRSLRQEFQKMRRIANKCLGLVANEEHRRVIRDLIAHIDRQIGACESMTG